MRIRLLTPFIAVSVMACAAETADEAAVAEEPQEYAAEADAGAALAALAANFQTHYNMGHGSVVANNFIEDGLFWSGDGSMTFGQAAIAAQFQGTMDGISPQISITHEDEVVAGAFAMSRGTYRLTGAADDAPVSMSGYWTSLSENIDGAWKLHGIIGNLGGAEQMMPPMGDMPDMPDMPAAEESASLLTESSSYYMTHFNMGHGGMVASNSYTDDAIVMASGAEMISGMAAVTERLNGMTAAGMKVNIVPFAARDLGDGLVAGIGTYTLEGTPDGTVNGHFHALYQRQDDGALKIKWLLTSNHPSAM